MKSIAFTLVFLLSSATFVCAETNALSQLYHLKNAKTRSISPENFTGEKGKGGMAKLEEGTAHRAARELGQGWKVNPYVYVEPGATFTLGEIEGQGIINHIWMTPVGDYRLMILRFYWDDETTPSVEVPVGDFFVSGWGMGNEPRISSLAMCVNPRNGFNSYWQMPFRKGWRITMENLGDERATVYYQIDYSLEDVPKNTPYFHAQFRRVNPLPHKQDFTIVDGIRGRGQYVGTSLLHGANSPGWWGEGEIKFFMDGDDAFPTICGTGEEDYFCGSYGYAERMVDGKEVYENFSSPYAGFYHVADYEGTQRRFGQYRWHITDPIRFETDLRVTIQSLGWKDNGAYLPLEDDLASVAYWYQVEPHNPFPPLPTKENLVIVDEFALSGLMERNVFIDQEKVALKRHLSTEEIRYTLDGSMPTLNSTLYAEPFVIEKACIVNALGFANGKPVTPVLTGEFMQQEPQPAVDGVQPRAGVTFTFIRLDRPLESTRELEGREAGETGVTEALRLPTGGLPGQFGMVFQGYLRIPVRGVYTFFVSSNDGSNLYIADQHVVENDGPHGDRERAGQIALERGYHFFRLEYFQAGAARALKVSLTGPDMAKQEVPAAMLSH